MYVRDRMITVTVCFAVIVLFAILFLKTCRIELQEITTQLNDLIRAALAEFQFRGGRSAKANVILLCFLLLVLFLVASAHGILDELIQFSTGQHDQNGRKYFYGLVAALIFFFLVSICIVAAQERYLDIKKRRR